MYTKTRFLKRPSQELLFSLIVWGVCLGVKVYVSVKFDSEPPLLTLAIAISAMFTSTSYATFMLVFASIIAEVYFFTEPHFAWKIPSNNELAQVLIYSTVNLFTGYVVWTQSRIVNQLIEIRSHQKRWFSNLSHEVRNSVYGLDELIEIYSEGSAPILLDNIKSSSRNLSKLVKNIFDYSKVESKIMQLDEVPFYLNQEFVALAESYRTRAYKKGLVFEVSFDHLPNEVYADGAKLIQVISNLLDNALKYTDKGGIFFRASAVEDIDEDKSSIQFSIIDTGCGIPNNDREQIFNPFFRSSASLRNTSGLGLGLSISNEIVNLMGSRIVYSPNSPKGSQFTFEVQFKILKSESSVSEISHSQNANIQQNTKPVVLVVEDSIDLAFSIKNKLQYLGCQVFIADTAEDASKYVAMKKFEIIFVDLNLPDNDGLSLIKQIRNIYRESIFNPYFVGMSANKDYLENITKQDALEFNVLIDKPIFFSQLVNILNQNNQIDIKPYDISLSENREDTDSELFQIFIERKEERIISLKNKLNQENWLSLGKYSHSLRSSFLAIGDQYGSQICLDIERYCHLRKTDDVRLNVDQLIKHIEFF